MNDDGRADRTEGRVRIPRGLEPRRTEHEEELDARRPLNPELYLRLKSRFGEVKVSNPGQAMVAETEIDFVTGRPRLMISQQGEGYAVCCAFCRDRNFRLSVSHMWGQRDEGGQLLLFLARCHSSNCLADPRNREEFIDSLGGRDGILETARIYPATATAPDPSAGEWPGKVTRIQALPRTHAAWRFLRRQGLDPDMVGRSYGVRYCEESPHAYARDRLIIPVCQGGQHRGWQALRIDGPDGRVGAGHYFTAPGMQRSQFLYNFDLAREYETGVIVVDPLDVWAFGPMAVSPFGVGMSEVQLRLFLVTFHRHSAILLLRPGDFGHEAAQQLIQDLVLGMSGQFTAIKLPSGKTFASMGCDAVRDYAVEEARRRGVRVQLRRRLS
jgi:hypothetical protein